MYNNSLEINYNTIKIREAGQDIIRLSKELNDTLEDLYLRINNMPDKTKEWVGVSAIRYAQRLNKEKSKYIEFKNTINEYGTYLVNVSYEIEKIIKKNQI